MYASVAAGRPYSDVFRHPHSSSLASYPHSRPSLPRIRVHPLPWELGVLTTHGRLTASADPDPDPGLNPDTMRTNRRPGTDQMTFRQSQRIRLKGPLCSPKSWTGRRGEGWAAASSQPLTRVVPSRLCKSATGSVAVSGIHQIGWVPRYLCAPASGDIVIMKFVLLFLLALLPFSSPMEIFTGASWYRDRPRGRRHLKSPEEEIADNHESWYGHMGANARRHEFGF